MLRFAAEALRNTAGSHEAGKRHDPDLVEQSTLPLRTCGQQGFLNWPWHVSRSRLWCGVGTSRRSRKYWVTRAWPWHSGTPISRPIIYEW